MSKNEYSTVDLLAVGTDSVTVSNVSDYLRALKVEHEAVDARSKLTTWAAVQTWITARDFSGDTDLTGALPTTTGEFAVQVGRAPSYGSLVKALTYAFETFGASPHADGIKGRAWADIVQGRFGLKALKAATSLTNLYDNEGEDAEDVAPESDEVPESDGSGESVGVPITMEAIESAVLTWLASVGSKDEDEIVRMTALMDTVHDGIDAHLMAEV